MDLDLTVEYNLAFLVLRLTLGLMIIVHGYNKIFRGGKLAGTARWFESMGMRPGWLHARLAAFTEVGSGLLLALGLFTQIGSAALIGIMVVAFWTVHARKGFLITKEGWEYVGLIAAMAWVAAIVGPGEYSIDHGLGIAGDLDGWTGLWIALIVGVGSGVAQLMLFYRPSAARSG